MMTPDGWARLLTEFVNPGTTLLLARDNPRLPPELKALVGCPQDPKSHPEGDAYAHTCHVLNGMSDVLSREGVTGERRLTFMLAALLHDVGKATTTRWNEEKQKWTSYGHDVAGVPIARSFLESLGNFSGNIPVILGLVRGHMAHCRKDFSQKAVRKLARDIQPATIADLLYVMEADCAGRPPLPKGLPPVVTEQLVPIARENGWLEGPHPADRRASGVSSCEL